MPGDTMRHGARAVACFQVLSFLALLNFKSDGLDTLQALRFARSALELRARCVPNSEVTAQSLLS